MPRRTIVLAALFAASAAGIFAQTKTYRIDLVSGGVLWSNDQPMQSGEQILFHGYPAGPLESLRRTDIKRIVAVTAPPASSQIKPGESKDVGQTGSAGRSRTGSGAAPGRAGTGSAASGSTAAGKAPLRPGEAKGGTALFNPDRPYQPSWDGKLVPGATMGLPNSPNDYREGTTLAHPSGTAVQASPGDVPKAPNQ